MTDSRFASLPLHPDLLGALTRLGYEQMTPIQAAALPPALLGRDLIAQAIDGTLKVTPLSETQSHVTWELETEDFLNAWGPDVGLALLFRGLVGKLRRISLWGGGLARLFAGLFARLLRQQDRGRKRQAIGRMALIDEPGRARSGPARADHAHAP